jgi:hypothetical protein
VRNGLRDLLQTRRNTARNPSSARAHTSRSQRAAAGDPKETSLPDTMFLKKVLIGLQHL